MPQVVRLDGVGDTEMAEWLQSAMDRIAAALEPGLG
jgi:hypothetical protein